MFLCSFCETVNTGRNGENEQNAYTMHIGKDNFREG